MEGEEEEERTTMMMMRARHSAQTRNYGTGGMKVAMKPEGETVSHQGEEIQGEKKNSSDVLRKYFTFR